MFKRIGLENQEKSRGEQTNIFQIRKQGSDEWRGCVSSDQAGRDLLEFMIYKIKSTSNVRQRYKSQLREELQQTGPQEDSLYRLCLSQFTDTFWFLVSSTTLWALSLMSKEGEMSYTEAIEKAHDSFCRFPLIPVQGVPLMNYIANNWDTIWAFRPDPSDILIATYPKAGTSVQV